MRVLRMMSYPERITVQTINSLLAREIYHVLCKTGVYLRRNHFSPYPTPSLYPKKDISNHKACYTVKTALNSDML